MNQLSRIVVLLTAVLGVLMPVVPTFAQADPIGGVIVISGTGSDLTAIRLRTSAGCPAKADAYYATMKGHGFPSDGQIVTSNISAGLSHSFGFDVYLAQIMRDFATQNHTTLSGRYDITVLCIDSFTVNSFGEFTGALEFTNPTTYRAIGDARPTGPLPAPLALAGDGSALTPAPSQAPPPAEASSSAEPPGKAGEGPPASTTGQPAPKADPQPSSAASNLSSQGDDVTDQNIPWPALAGAALVALIVVAAVTHRIRKRRSS